ncbi:ubiquinol-cytochrome-c reductase complex assembly factor 4 [Sardina pilchardus]|uniref:ubiquinol-cytochrome-c reductase complex assembly factor 4 n=1 Tax=Sardina pilchardus TaxID=27697 RepID=UPI002E11B6B6
MSTTGQRIFSHMARYHRTCRRILLNGVDTFPRYPVSARALSVSHKLCAKSKKPPEDEFDEPPSEPIKFSTSKGSHRTWSVDRSLGSKHQRPWWRVVPISVVGVVFLLWCGFRAESDVDEALEKQLYEHLPSLLSDEEESDKSR